MWKKVFVGAAALMIAGSITVSAQQDPEGPAGSGSPGGHGGRRPSAEDIGTLPDSRIAELHAGHRFNAEDMAAFADARIAALHAGLKLNPDQEKTWPAFEQALRDLAKMRMDTFAATLDQPSSDPVQRLQSRAEALSVRGAALKRLADTLAPLYQSLDDGQKRRFTVLGRSIRGAAHDFGGGDGRRD